MTAAMFSSTARRIQVAKSILADRYEPGRQDRNKAWVYRTEVEQLLGISRRTFSRYINTPEKTVADALRPKDEGRQLSLFPEGTA